MMGRVLEGFRPPEGSDIREMPDRALIGRVAAFFALSLVGLLSAAVTSSGTWAYSLSAGAVLLGLMAATPGAIELYARAGDEA